MSAPVRAAQCVYRGDVFPAKLDELVLDSLVDDVTDEHDKHQEHKQRDPTCDTPHRISVYMWACIWWVGVSTRFHTLTLSSTSQHHAACAQASSVRRVTRHIHTSRHDSYALQKRHAPNKRKVWLIHVQHLPAVSMHTHKHYMTRQRTAELILPTATQTQEKTWLENTQVISYCPRPRLATTQTATHTATHTSEFIMPTSRVDCFRARWGYSLVRLLQCITVWCSARPYRVSVHWDFSLTRQLTQACQRGARRGDRRLT